jgi:hypothetical protein
VKSFVAGPLLLSLALPACLAFHLTACSGRDAPLQSEVIAQTSLGDLVRVQRKEQVVTSGEPISPEPDEMLWVLDFEGRLEIPYDPGYNLEGSSYYPLVDASGRRYSAILVGTPNEAGALTLDGWDVSPAQIIQKDGLFTLESTVKLPRPKVSIVYSVPRDASKLTLQDGDRRHELPEPK